MSKLKDRTDEFAEIAKALRRTFKRFASNCFSDIDQIVLASPKFALKAVVRSATGT